VTPDPLDLCTAVYQATEAWDYGRTSAPVIRAERALRTALDTTPPTLDEHPCVSAARTVHALGGFHFDRRCDREDPAIGDAEVAWGEAMRIYLNPLETT
jgi:hypothetical protein